jgi:hypothetical protein
MVSTAEVSVALTGINFPATKQQMIDYAKNRGAPQEVIDGLQRLKSERFLTMSEVWHEIGEEAA